jgi:hypothetical protein
MQVTRPQAPGSVALGDGLLIQTALRVLALRLGLPAGASGAFVPPLTEALAALQTIEAEAELLHLCRVARFPDAELAARRLGSLLDRVARYINGSLRDHQGGDRTRLLVTLGVRIDRLRRYLPRVSARARRVLPASLMDAAAEVGLDFPVSVDLGRRFLDGLDGLLTDFGSGLAAMQAQVAQPIRGRPPLSDALCFGVEGWLAIWRSHHDRSPTASLNTGGFVQTGAEALLLAMRVNGDLGLELATRRSIEAALIAELWRAPDAPTGAAPAT